MDKIHVLIIEDDAFLAQIYSKAFVDDGFEVSVVGKANDGFKLIDREKPHIVLLDLLLPDIDDDIFTVLKRLKESPEISQIPVIILSNIGQREDVDSAMKLGAAGYLIKAHTLPQDAIRKVKEILQLA